MRPDRHPIARAESPVVFAPASVVGRRGFSLVEVMLAVLVLALGLLGLGAVIPVIIKDQQQSTAAVRAVSAANDCQAALRNRPDLNRASVQMWVPGDGVYTYVPVGWGAWLENHPLRDPSNPQATDYEWVIPDDDDEFDPVSGEYEFHAPGWPAWSRVTIPVADRLWPPGAAEVTAPLFVYDFVARRVPSPLLGPPQVQVAMFLRRIDQNIKVTRGTLREVLTGSLSNPPSPLPLPVAVTANTPIACRPTLNGLGRYAMPIRLNARYDATLRDRLIVEGSDLERRLASQFGQRLVDNLGNVHIVSKVDETYNGARGGVRLVVEQPVPAWVKSTSAFRAAEPRDTALRHIVMTPQVPVAIRVFTVSVTDTLESWTGSGAGSQPGGAP